MELVVYLDLIVLATLRSPPLLRFGVPLPPPPPLLRFGVKGMQLRRRIGKWSEWRERESKIVEGLYLMQLGFMFGFVERLSLKYFSKKWVNDLNY